MDETEQARFFRTILSSPSFERHGLGRFGEAILNHLAHGVNFGLDRTIRGVRPFVTIDSIELGDNPFHEEISISFRLTEEPPSPDHLPSWGPPVDGRKHTYSLKPGEIVTGQPTTFFTFTGEISLEENIAEFRQLVEKMGRLLAPIDQQAATENPPSDALKKHA